MPSPRNYANFLMTGTQRTGSSALAELVNTHPAIACGWEWGEHVPIHKKLSVLNDALDGRFDDLRANEREHIEASLAPETRWLGCRRLFGASDKWLFSPRHSLKLLADRFDAHLRWLDRRRDLRLIHVVRSDHIGWLKSKFVARSVGTFVGDAYPEDARVTIPIREARARIRAKIWLDERLAALADTHAYLHIEYRDFTAAPLDAARACAAFLDCDPQALAPETTELRKQSTRDDREYIANYDELVDAIAAIAASSASSERGA
ncbi:MAG: sulfotransferase [Pseudomonadota bacterium]